MQLGVRDLVIRYGEVVAVDGISFQVAEGEFVSLLGPSGCGKTTTLRCIAGLESLSSGEIRIAGDIVAGAGREVAPERRGVNMVFQSYAIWPHMSVFDNVAYGLRRRPRAEVQRRVGEALRMVGLSGLERRYGTELSGGQQQRVAVARAVVTEPRLLLFDEPLSNLDAGLRERMRFELLELQRRLGRTSIYVTHDQAEAMVMSDRIILMHRGRIVQESSPRELYEHPASRFAAEFVGSANLLDGRIIAGDGAGHWRVRLAEGVEISATGRLVPPASGAVLVCIRPETIAVVPPETAGDNMLDASVSRVSYLGTSLQCEFATAAGPLRAELPTAPLPDGPVRLRLDPARVVLVPAEAPTA
jgi:iron(III) transport system ATP-binding protein/putative spermidine/putrescine transport system ATP-binding protein